VTRLVLIRHGPTAWNAAGRMQGRSDVPLSPAGRALVGRLVPPPEWKAARWVTSPLSRAVETAALLGAPGAEVEPRLVEMDWGRWEGQTLSDLRARFPDAMLANENRGLDFRPEGGESPRDVQRRLRPWLAEIAAAGRDTVAVTHKGVIRAVVALAYDWDMQGRPPIAIDATRAFPFRLAPDGEPRPDGEPFRLAPEAD